MREAPHMKLEFLIPGSPNDAFYSQIAFFRFCLDSMGSIYEDARVVAVFGDDSILELPDRWVPFFDHIDIEWVQPADFVKSSKVAHFHRRYEVIRDDTDVAFLCDADVAPLAPFDELAQALIEAPALAGVIAHYHFPWPGRERVPDTDWSEIARDVIGRSIDTPFRYTLLELDAPASSPFYLNYGLIAGPPSILRKLHFRDQQIRPHIVHRIGPTFGSQVSLALACADLQLPTRALPMRYNYPNDPIADHLYPEELQDIKLLHYLRTRHFDRQAIFASESEFHRFIDLDLAGSNRVFQDRVLELTGDIYPFRY